VFATQGSTTTCTVAPRRRRHPLGAARVACLVGVLHACSGGDATAPAPAPTTSAPATPIAPRVTRLGPDTLTAGGTLIIEGLHFPAALADIQLTVGGVPLAVRAASATRIEATMPDTAFACRAVTAMPVRLRLASIVIDTVAPVATATRLALSPGETAQLLETHESRCLELVAPTNGTTARYVVAVVNTSTDPNGAATVDLRGTGTGSLAGVESTEQLHGLTAHWRSSPLPPAPLPADASGFHTRSLTTSVSATAAWSSATRTTLKSLRAPLQLGDTLSITALLGSCTTGKPLEARVVYAGTRALILEDLAAPRAGRMDGTYKQLGTEYEQVVHPLLTGQIGNPLAMNATMGGDGRITMLFTPFVNDSAPGTAAYVSACNFYPRATFAGSNENEVIYARIATAHETPDDWRRAMRSTIVHEAKHLASFAERLARGHGFDDAWMEEATARIAEELYARTFPGGGSFRGRTGFAGSVGCELRLCDDRPLIMWKHFSQLHQYLAGGETLTPLGPAHRADATHYASGWSLVRWALDAFATEESQALRALVRGGGGRGVEALASSIGRPRDEVVTGWAIANAVGALGSDLTNAGQASWNVPDVWSGLAREFPGAFRATPLQARQLTFGRFSTHVAALAPLGVHHVVLAGEQSGAQLLVLEGARMDPSGLRLLVSRLP